MKILRPQRREYVVLRWLDPESGSWKQEQTNIKRKRDAVEEAVRKANEVLGRVPTHYGRLTWSEFTALYESLVNDSRVGNRGNPWRAVQQHIKRYPLRPVLLEDVDTLWVTRFKAWLSKTGGLASSTVNGHMSRLRAALRWAVKQEIIAKAPYIEVNLRGVPRSRAITPAEFQRFLKACRKVRPDDWKQWDRFLRGQYHCGLRLSELMRLSWDQDAPIRLSRIGRFPAITLSPEANKSGTLKVRPVSPEFWSICLETEPAQQQGTVFPLIGRWGPMTLVCACQTISDIGRASGVITNPATGKHVTSHDLRRSYLTGLDDTLTLKEVQMVSGHKDLATLATYYVQKDVQNVAQKLWAGVDLGGALGGAPSKKPRISR